MASKLINKTPMKITGSREQLSMDPVEVFCRIRPIPDPNVEVCAKALDEHTLQINEPSGQEEATVKGVQAKFTQVFEQTAKQGQIFERVAFDLCKDLLQGKNGLLFTYGITGSGKTYTMTGVPNDPGLLPRCLDIIFNSISLFQADPYIFVSDKQNGFDIRTKAVAEMDRARYNLCPAGTTSNLRSAKSKKFIKSEWNLNSYSEDGRNKLEVSRLDQDSAFAVFVSYIQIYNDYIYDLLDTTSHDRPKILDKVYEDPVRNVMFIPGAIEVEVRNVDEAFDVLARGQRARQTAQTALNAESSRSHCIFMIRLVKAPFDETGTELLQDKNKVHIAQLALVDLAGSERISRTETTGRQQGETGFINNSLMVLRQCLEILRDKQKTGRNMMVPYRTKKLTHLFKSYFDGEGKVKMIVCINPSPNDFKENVHVLKFAELTKEVKVQPGASTHNQINDGLTPGRRRAAQIIKEVKEELEQMLQRHRVGGSPPNPALPQQPPAFPMVFEPMPLVDLSSVDEETLRRLRQHFEAQLHKRQEVVAEVTAKQSAFEEALKKYIIDMESLKRRHDECGNYVKDLNSDNKRLKEENRRLREQMSAYETRLRKYEHDARFLLNREEAMKERERVMAANYRAKDDKLRAVKEIFDRPPTGAVSSLSKRRGPSPPPKLYRLRDKELVANNGPAFNLRRHRRSQSIGDLSSSDNGQQSQQQPSTSNQAATNTKPANKFAPVTPYCPGNRQRRIKYETSSSDSDFAAGKRRSDEICNESASAAKRGREN